MALVQTPNMPVLADPIIPSLLSHATDLEKHHGGGQGRLGNNASGGYW